MSTAQIYWGAVPFLLMQLVMVAVVIAFPELVGSHQASRDEAPPLRIELPVE